MSLLNRLIRWSVVGSTAALLSTAITTDVAAMTFSGDSASASHFSENDEANIPWLLLSQEDGKQLAETLASISPEGSISPEKLTAIVGAFYEHPADAPKFTVSEETGTAQYGFYSQKTVVSRSSGSSFYFPAWIWGDVGLYLLLEWLFGGSNGRATTSTVVDWEEVVALDAAENVPTPALLPGLVGMGVAALRKRQQAKAD
ncbi:MAG: PTPA-CTERM sorting domain-containing protein [Cyanobacteria bacterium J06649_4]